LRPGVRRQPSGPPQIFIKVLSLIIASQLSQGEFPKSLSELIGRFDAAYHDLTNYTDTWDLTNSDSPGRFIRFRRSIDGNRVALQIYDVKESIETPLAYEGANGKEEWIVCFPAKSYFLGPDKHQRINSPLGPAAVCKLWWDPFVPLVVASDPLVLRSIVTNPVNIAQGKVATVEAQEKDKLTIKISMMNRWWLPTDFLATMYKPDGQPETIDLRAVTLMMNAKLARNAFAFDKGWIKEFTAKSREQALADAATVQSGV